MGYFILSNGLVAHNRALEDAGGIRVYNGQADLYRVGIIYNHADNIAGGLKNEYGQLNLTNVTISHNTALVGSWVGGGGGGLYLGGSTIFSSQTRLSHATVVYNRAGIDAGGISMENGELLIQNSIVAHDEAGGNCTKFGRGGVISFGGNFEDTNLCDFGDPADYPNTPPQVGVLHPEGYHALLAYSPAINAAACIPMITIDQIGAPRPYGPACDSGAIEAQFMPADPPTPTQTSTPSPTASPTPTATPSATPSPSPTATSTLSPTPTATFLPLHDFIYLPLIQTATASRMIKALPGR